MTDFLVGFEFEFGWLLSSFPEKKPKSKCAFFQSWIMPEVKAELDKVFPNIPLEIKEDSTLYFNTQYKYWQTHYGVEVVTLPMKEKDAQKFLTKFLSWLQSKENIEINKTCSLHLNLSFTDTSKNHKIDYWKLLNIYPQEETLSVFNRHDNDYCKNSKDVKFSYEENSCVSKERTLTYWKNKIQLWRQSNQSQPVRQIKMIKKAYNAEQYQFSKQVKKSFPITHDLTTVESTLNELYQKRIISMRKNLAIVRKNEESPYYEFRMVGNKDYHMKKTDILNALELSKQYLVKSVVA